MTAVLQRDHVSYSHKYDSYFVKWLIGCTVENKNVETDLKTWEVDLSETILAPPPIILWFQYYKGNMCHILMYDSYCV